MAAFIAAWLTGQGLIAWRSWKVQGGPPWPGQMIAASGLFIILAIIGSAGDQARRAATTLAWGVVIAAAYNTYDTSRNFTLPGQAARGWWNGVASAANLIPPGQILPSHNTGQPPGTAGAIGGNIGPALQITGAPAGGGPAPKAQ